MRLLKSSLFWFTVLAVLFLLVGLHLTVRYWGWLHPEDSETVSNSETLRNVGFLIAGGLALVFALWRGWVAERQAAAAQLQADIAQDSSLNERYEQGAEMLGSNVLSVRLGGIYALERLAAEHPEQYHIQVMNLLCAFVRNPTNYEGYAVKPSPPYSAREDVQVAARTIGNRGDTGITIEEREAFMLDLHGADLSGVVLHQSNLAKADLSRSNLVPVGFDEVDLSGAVFLNAILSSPEPQCELHPVESGQKETRPRANFHNTNVSGAQFSLFGLHPAEGVLQEQMDFACADPDDPPMLLGVLDAETGKQVTWSGRPC